MISSVTPRLWGNILFISSGTSGSTFVKAHFPSSCPLCANTQTPSALTSLNMCSPLQGPLLRIPFKRKLKYLLFPDDFSESICYRDVGCGKILLCRAAGVWKCWNQTLILWLAVWSRKKSWLVCNVTVSHLHPH